MKGPTPKPDAIRQRRNRSTTQATLSADGQAKRAPALLPKDREWHKLTRAWWHDTWHSPMAAEYVGVDVHALYRLAVLIDDFWKEPGKETAAEIRLQLQAFGQTPLDRRRLQWEIERVEQTSRKPPTVQAPPVAGDDPRDLLRVVS